MLRLLVTTTSPPLPVAPLPLFATNEMPPAAVLKVRSAAAPAPDVVRLIPPPLPVPAPLAFNAAATPAAAETVAAETLITPPLLFPPEELFCRVPASVMAPLVLTFSC